VGLLRIEVITRYTVIISLLQAYEVVPGSRAIFNLSQIGSFLKQIL